MSIAENRAASLDSFFVTLAFILLLPLYVGLYYATGQPVDDNQLAFLANLSTLLSFLIAGGLIYLLVKFPEWYVVDAIGIVTAAGVTAILNFAPAVITVPEGVWLRKVDLSIELQILSFYQQRRMGTAMADAVLSVPGG